MIRSRSCTNHRSWQKKQEFFRIIEESTKEAGTSKDAGGQPLTAELILEVWEKLIFTFDKHGVWKMPQMTGHPAQAERYRQELARIENEGELRQRFNELLERKRREWNARQANRKLVD